MRAVTRGITRRVRFSSFEGTIHNARRHISTGVFSAGNYQRESLQKEEEENIENGDDDDDGDYEEKMASRVATAKDSKEAAKRTTGNRRLVKME